jgi:hypothetical protein
VRGMSGLLIGPTRLELQSEGTNCSISGSTAGTRGQRNEINPPDLGTGDVCSNNWKHRPNRCPSRSRKWD